MSAEVLNADGSSRRFALLSVCDMSKVWGSFRHVRVASRNCLLFVHNFVRCCVALLCCVSCVALRSAALREVTLSAAGAQRRSTGHELLHLCSKD